MLFWILALVVLTTIALAIEQLLLFHDRGVARVQRACSVSPDPDPLDYGWLFAQDPGLNYLEGARHDRVRPAHQHPCSRRRGAA